MTDKKRKLIAAGSIAAFVLLLLAAFWFGGRPIIALASEPQAFRAVVEEWGLPGKLAFVGMMVLQVFVAFIPGEPLEICAGYAFGAWEGTLLCIAGAVIGGAIVFGVVRLFGVRAVEVFFPREKINSLSFLRDAKRLNLLVFMVFFIPGTPKDLLSYCVGLTKMRFGVWLLISGIARIPSIVTSTIGGDALGMGKSGFAAVMFGVTLAISAGGLLLYNGICKRRGKRTDAVR